jgi:hypothetical protein
MSCFIFFFPDLGTLVIAQFSVNLDKSISQTAEQLFDHRVKFRHLIVMARVLVPISQTVDCLQKKIFFHVEVAVLATIV